MPTGTEGDYESKRKYKKVLMNIMRQNVLIKVLLVIWNMNIKMFCSVKNEMNRIKHEINRIQSKGHNIGTYNIKRLPLSSYYNNKEYIL